MWRWNTVHDEAEHRIRVECVVFVQWYAWDLNVIEIRGPEVDNVCLRVLVQLGTLDEDVCSTVKRGILNAVGIFGLEERGFWLL